MNEGSGSAPSRGRTGGEHTTIRPEACSPKRLNPKQSGLTTECRASDAEFRTVLFQPPNGVGLGHVSRLIAIAVAMGQRRAALRTPFVLAGGGQELLRSFGLPFLSLPSPRTLRSAPWEPWPEPERRRVIVALSEAVVQAFGPELVVFDTLPYEPLLRTVIERGIPFAVCARKCRDMTAYFDRMTRFLTAARLIVVPHEPGSFAVPKALEPRTHFVGAVRRTAALGHVGDRSSGGPYVLISGGGGGYPSNTQFYNCAIHAFRIVRRTYPALGGVLVTGPLFEDWWNLDVAEGVRVVPFDGDFVCTLSGASVAVCRGGYNTIAEIAGAGIPAICVPAEAKFDDQSERALQLAAGRSGVEVLFTFDPEPMAAAIIRMLSSPSLSPRPNSEQHGADSAASLLLATLA